MSGIVNLVGKRFGRLVILEFVRTDKYYNPTWLAECDCGNVVMVRGKNICNGHTQSCGCLKKDKHTKHGLTRTKLYRTHQGIIQRCNNPKAPGYHNYGGRGIIISEELLSFTRFCEEVGEPPSDKHQIDRINNDKGYEVGNLHWVTNQENAWNTRRSRLVTFDGITQTIAKWAYEKNMCRQTLTKRLNNGWSAKEALTTPVNKNLSRTREAR